MALPDVAALKRVLKIETTAEDTLVAELLARAMGPIQRYIGAPIVSSEDRVFFDEAVGTPRSLLIPETPIDTEAVEIEDRDGTVIDAALLRIDPQTGIVRYLDGITRFPFGPYQITATIGLDTLAEYAIEIEPVVSQAIVDVVSDLYNRRNPAATQESSNGITRSYGASGLPLRVEENLNGIRRPL